MSRPVAGLLLCGLFVSPPGVAEELHQAAPIRPSHGYLLIRIAGASGERIERFEFTNQETGYVVTMRTDVCKPAGPRARMRIVISPPGRYFWSKYEVEYRIGMEQSLNQDPPIIREAPGSASDTFEIAPGVINYIGDWEMRISAGDVRSSVTRRWSVDIRQDTSLVLFVDATQLGNACHEAFRDAC
jgi:hypothetical protein